MQESGAVELPILMPWTIVLVLFPPLCLSYLVVLLETKGLIIAAWSLFGWSETCGDRYQGAALGNNCVSSFSIL